MPSGIHEVNVEFSENRALCGFRCNVLLNAFYFFAFFLLMQLLLMLLFLLCFYCFFSFMQLSISAFNVKFSGNRAVRGFRWNVLLT
jgi:hypothetical protein